MANYAQDADDEALYPDDGQYSVVAIDHMKPPDEPDFINKIGEFDSADDVVLPSDTQDMSYYVYHTDGEQWGRDQWVAEIEEDE